ncbi:MAG TPA: HD domain-containing protein [Caproiciproducens sp.]|nr:HD domain-containing protein [Caproiciproducens sp.]
MSGRQELFLEMEQHLMQDRRPSDYFNSIAEDPLLQEEPFFMLSRLKKTGQSPKYHPEGNVWNHTMLVVDQAAEMKEFSDDPKTLMWAALLHDIGKPDTTRNRKGKITSYNHERAGSDLTVKFLSCFTQDHRWIEKVAALVRWHMQVLFVMNDLPFGDIQSMKEQTNVREVGLLGFCDRMGRLGSNREQEEDNYRIFLEKISCYSRTQIIA